MENKNVNSIEVQKYLTGVSYPADKQQLVESAESNNAPQDVLDVLNHLPDNHDFETPAAVSEELSSRTEQSSGTGGGMGSTSQEVSSSNEQWGEGDEMM